MLDAVRYETVRVTVLLAVAAMHMRVRLTDGRRSAWQPEMTVRASVRVAVQASAVAVNVRVGGEHRVKAS